MEPADDPGDAERDYPWGETQERWPALLAAPDAENVRAALDRLLSSTAFTGVRRSKQLLHYLVEEVLADRGVMISEYSVAHDVFERDHTFDPAVDSCVRTEMWRLRKRLRDFYSGEGAGDPLRIDFSQRLMAPQFHRAPSLPQAKGPGRSILIEIAPSPNRSDEEREFADHLGAEIAQSLIHVPHVRPYLRGDRNQQFDARLRCHVRETESAFRVVTTLLDEATGEVLASESFSQVTGSVPLPPARVGEAAAHMVAQGVDQRQADLPVDLIDDQSRARYLDDLLTKRPDYRAERLAELKLTIRRLERLVQQDDKNTLLHRRLIGAWNLFISLVPTAAPHVLARISQAAKATVAVNAKLSDVWQTLGMAQSFAYYWKPAEDAYRCAIRCDPLNGSPHTLLAFSLMQRGQIQQALEAAEAAIELDPLSPAASSSYALALVHARRFSEAVDTLERGLAINPGAARLRVVLGDAHLQLGNFDKAINEFETAQTELRQELFISGYLGLAHARVGNVDKAHEILLGLQREHAPFSRELAAEALVQTGLGMDSHALDSISEATRRAGSPYLFLHSPAFDRLRSTQRFVSLQREISGRHLPA